MEKKTYRLTADIGDLKRGETIQLTDEKAASPLYASRIVRVEAESVGTISYNLEELRAEVLQSLQAEADKLTEEAKATADKLIAEAQAEAKKIVEAAQAEAMKLAAGNGKK